MANVIPYDPPLRRTTSQRSRRSSLSRGLSHAGEWLDDVANVAERVESGAREVEKGARLGRHFIDEIEEAYGDEAATSPERFSTSSHPPRGKTEEQRQRPNVPEAPLKKRSVKQEHLLSEIPETQAAVKHLLDNVQAMARRRDRLLKRLEASASTRRLSAARAAHMDREKRTKLAIRLLHTADELIEQYKAVSTLPARISAPTSEDPKHSTAAKIDRKMAQLNSAFARLLDFVEEQAREEKGAVEASRVDALLVWEISRTHPDWTAPQIKEQLKLAKQEPRAQSLATISPDSYAYLYVLMHPFSYLDERVISAIDLAEQGISSRQDEQAGTWALHKLAAQARTAVGTVGRLSSSTTAGRAPKLSKGRPSSRRKVYSEGKRSDRKETPLRSDDSMDDLEKQKEKLLHGAAWAVDVSKLPERVPTDDTSGYQETQAELIADAIDESRTEHLLTPVVSLFWLGIFVLYGYYFIARFAGFPDPLGRVDLGETFGDEAWNETDAAVMGTSIASAAAAASEAARSSSLYSMASVIESAMDAGRTTQSPLALPTPS